MVLRKNVILKMFRVTSMQECDSERVTEGIDRNAIRMDLGFTKQDNPKVTACQGVFTLQVIRISFPILRWSHPEPAGAEMFTAHWTLANGAVFAAIPRFEARGIGECGAF